MPSERLLLCRVIRDASISPHLILQPLLVIDEALLSLVVAAAGACLVAASPVWPVDSVSGWVPGLVEMGVQAADLVDGERDQIVGFVPARVIGV
ncbi:hypothetical protein HUT06_15315 [Actinomadura sp. NAK00032]|uniref:hypothetical protein n=1 Tax=Actinomadura sp. NAK00032 TaxID=2742128 RepID=UPI00159059C4|nr:hypothetical protein [Actinomadura sp. NAK00032]QKW32609.1 hypothetical protein HUT06_15315 [Actinomadura sp. NAK00032]